MNEFKYFVFALLLSGNFVHGQKPERNTAAEDLTLTYSQTMALDKFRARVRPILPHRYMKEDAYLINFLRAKDFNVNQAEKFIKENLKWRRLNKVDRIQDEDFSDVMDDFPVSVDTYDKNGAPVITAIAGRWDIRKAILTGRYPRVQRYLYKIMDEAAMKVRKAQLEGKSVTRFQFLLNLQGFNLVQHGCPRCVLEIVDFVQSYENYFPGMTDKVVIFNAPPSVQVISPAIHAVMSRHSHDHVTLIGTNKPEWQKMLLKFIDASQLTEEFGGTRKVY